MSLDSTLNFPDFNFAMESDGKYGSYEFDEFRLDVDKLMLYRDHDEIPMPPKVVKTLVVLVEARGTILSKEELIDRVWSDAFVDESNLSQHLHRLRKALGNRADGRPYIETFRRRGYRFNGDVRRPNATKEPPTSVPRASMPAVEREGNVLRLVDWKLEPDTSRNEAPAEVIPTTAPTPTEPRRIWPTAIAGLAIVLTIVVIGGIVAYRSSASGPSAANGEITFLRLTNGIKPVDATISPNGDYFVYHELTEGSERLWLQQVGQANRVEVTSVSGRFFGAKTFSPDGKFVYFLTREEKAKTFTLNRVSTIGGPQAKIVDDVSGPPSFSPDGSQFVFVRSNDTSSRSALMVADSEGSTERELLRPDDRTRLVGSAAWSPDGKRIAFAVAEFDNTIRLYTIDTLGENLRRVSDERWDNVYRITWEPKALGVVMVATRVGESYSTRRNQVYYVSYADGESRRLTTDGSWHQEWSLGTTNDGAIITIPFNRSSQIWSLTADGSAASAMQLSRGNTDGRAGLAPVPDGKIGFISRVGDDVNIWSMEGDGSALKQLSSGTLEIVEELRADPKGRYFVFSGFKDGHTYLYRCDVDGRNLVQLTFDDGNPVDSTISHEGEWIVYHSAISGGVPRSPQLYRIPIGGGTPERFGSEECATPNYSPVDAQLTCVSGEEILRLSGVDGSRLQSYPVPPYSRMSTGAKWTPDGRGLVYIRNDRGHSNLWAQPVEGGEPRALTDFTVGDIYNFAFSFDGSRLFVARGQQVSDAVLIRNYR